MDLRTVISQWPMLSPTLFDKLTAFAEFKANFHNVSNNTGPKAYLAQAVIINIWDKRARDCGGMAIQVVKTHKAWCRYQ